jgi:hypothetical protein
VAAFARPAQIRTTLNAPPCSSWMALARIRISPRLRGEEREQEAQSTSGGEHGGRREGRGRSHAC